jgi:hypothetical protein
MPCNRNLSISKEEVPEKKQIIKPVPSTPLKKIVLEPKKPLKENRNLQPIHEEKSK